MVTIAKHQQAIKAIRNTMRILKYSSGIVQLETRMELKLQRIFKNHASEFWKLESRHSWLDKCYIKAQKDLAEKEKAVAKMGMSENPDEVLNFVGGLTEEWHDDINDDVALNRVLKESYVSGYNFAGQEALTEFKIKESFNLRGISYMNALDKRANLTAPQINGTSWDLVQNTIADGFWKEGKNTDKVARDLRGLFEETYKGRAENIARTETGNIVSEAQLESYEKMGIPELEWISEAGACELCRPLNGQIVKTGSNFNNGQGWQGKRPLVHPSCRCDVVGVVGKDYVPSRYWTGE